MFLRARVVYVPTHLRDSVIYVPTYLQANVPKACQFLICKYQRANKRTSMPYGVPICQLGVPKCQKAYQFFNFACQRAKRCANFSNIRLTKPKGNFYTLLYKKFYITFNIIVIYIICICTVHKNCIKIHFHISSHIEEKCGIFLFYLFLFFFFALYLEMKI